MSALERLRQSTRVDLDSLDLLAAQRYGPFVDCTSNQAIVWFELQKPQHAGLLQSAVRRAREWKGMFDRVTLEELSVEVVTISLALRILPHLTGCIHVQANTLHANSTKDIVDDALRIKGLSKLLDTNFDTDRLCIKIPSTWEGLQACRILRQQHGIKSLATTLFGVPQALMAGDVGCHYIAPYLHSLPDVLSNTLGTDASSIAELNKTLDFVITTQAFFKRFGLKTLVLPAALMTERECCVLEGADHMTLSPLRVEELASRESSNGSDPKDNTWHSLFKIQKSDSQLLELEKKLDELWTLASALRLHECHWKKSMQEADSGAAQRKTDEAIRVFDEMQRKLENMVANIV